MRRVLLPACNFRSAITSALALRRTVLQPMCQSCHVQRSVGCHLQLAWHSTVSAPIYVRIASRGHEGTQPRVHSTGTISDVNEIETNGSSARESLGCSKHMACEVANIMARGVVLSCQGGLRNMMLVVGRALNRCVPAVARSGPWRSRRPCMESCILQSRCKTLQLSCL